MKVYNYRVVLLKINIDKKMDQRIKEQLLNYDVNSEKVQQKWHDNEYSMSNIKSFIRSLPKL